MLAGAQAAAAQPGPDPHPSATKRQAPSPDPAPDSAPTRTSPAPDAAAPVAPSTSSSSVEPRVTTPTSPSVFRPPVAATTTRVSTAEQKTRASRPGRGDETVGASAKHGTKRLQAVVASVTDGGVASRNLVLGALGLLALALASGSLLFFVARAAGWEVRT